MASWRLHPVNAPSARFWKFRSTNRPAFPVPLEISSSILWHIVKSTVVWLRRLCAPHATFHCNSFFQIEKKVYTDFRILVQLCCKIRQRGHMFQYHGETSQLSNLRLPLKGACESKKDYETHGNWESRRNMHTRTASLRVCS